MFLLYLQILITILGKKKEKLRQAIRLLRKAERCSDPQAHSLAFSSPHHMDRTSLMLSWLKI